jgi:dihydroneopterin aldolase
MSSIKLEGISFYAHHGYYTHEQMRGNNYLVDVTVEEDIEQAALHDDLHLTINYESIYQVCADVMNHPCKLIETVAYRIAHGIRDTFPKTGRIEVVVHKLTPELGGPVHSAQVKYVLSRKDA